MQNKRKLELKTTILKQLKVILVLNNEYNLIWLLNLVAT